MPKLSDAMEEGTILRWLKTDGDAVRRGDELVEIETDKATVTYEADAEGVLEVVAAVGATLPVGSVIARLGENGVPAAPPPVAPEVPAAPRAAGAKGEVTVVEPTRAQAGIARRVAESRAIVPDFTVTVEADVAAAQDALTQLAARLDPAPDLDDLVVKACGLALREFPRVNGSYRDGHFELYSRVNVGIAVHGDGALTAPTIFDADTKPLADIAREAWRLSERARSGAITPPELAGATFTVSSLAAFGVRRHTAIITPPQAAVLAVGAEIGGTIELALSCDHRILYGAEAARFLARVRELLERPVGLVV